MRTQSVPLSLPQARAYDADHDTLGRDDIVGSSRSRLWSCSATCLLSSQQWVHSETVCPLAQGHASPSSSQVHASDFDRETSRHPLRRKLALSTLFECAAASCSASISLVALRNGLLPVCPLLLPRLFFPSSRFLSFPRPTTSGPPNDDDDQFTGHEENYAGSKH